MRGTSRFAGSCLLIALAIAASAQEREDENAPATLEGLERRLDELSERNRELEQSVSDLKRQVDGTEAQTPAPPAAPLSAAAGDPLWSRPIGSAGALRLLDVSLDVLAAVGGSTASDDELELLQGGGHDPRQRGFTLENVELSLLGAVDPYVRGETH